MRRPAVHRGDAARGQKKARRSARNGARRARRPAASPGAVGVDDSRCSACRCSRARARGSRDRGVLANPRAPHRRRRGRQRNQGVTVRTPCRTSSGRRCALVNDGEIRSELSASPDPSYETEVVPPNTLVVRDRRAQGNRRARRRERIPAGRPGRRDARDVDDASRTSRSSTSADAGVDSARIRGGHQGSAGDAGDRCSAEVESISATTLDNVSLTLAGQPQVIWGSSAQSELKAEALGTLLNRVRSRRCST